MRYHTSSINVKENPVRAAAARMKPLGVAATRGVFSGTGVSRPFPFFFRLFFESVAEVRIGAAASSLVGGGVSALWPSAAETGMGGPAQRIATTPTSAFTAQPAQRVARVPNVSRRKNVDRRVPETAP